MVTIDNPSTDVYNSVKENVNENSRPYFKMESTLQALNNVDSDYSTDKFIDTSTGTAVYNMDSVKAYLTKLAATPNYQKFIEEVNKGNWGLLNLAVQIALEAKGIEVGKIDGLMGPATKSAIRKFQRDYNSRHPGSKISVDGAVGPQTARALLDDFGVVVAPTNGGTTPPEGLEFKESMLKAEPQIAYVGGPIPADKDFVKGVPVGGTVSLQSALNTTAPSTQKAVLKVTVGGQDYFTESKLEVLTPEKYFDKKAKLENLRVMKDDSAPLPGAFVKDMPGGWTAAYTLGVDPDTSNRGDQNIQITITPTGGGTPFTKTVKLSVLENTEFKESMLKAEPQIAYVGGTIPADKDFVKGVPVGGTVSLQSALNTAAPSTQKAVLKVTVGGQDYFTESKLEVLTPEKYFDKKVRLENLRVMKDGTAPNPKEFVPDLPGGWTAAYTLGVDPDTSKEGDQNVQITITPTGGGTPFTKTVKLSVLKSA